MRYVLRLLGLLGLFASWYGYNRVIGFSTRDLSSAHNFIVANYVAIIYCFAGFLIWGHMGGYRQPVKLFFAWLRGDRKDFSPTEIEDFYQHNQGWILGLYLAFICLLANFIVGFGRLVHFFYTTPL